MEERDSCTVPPPNCQPQPELYGARECSKFSTGKKVYETPLLWQKAKKRLSMKQGTGCRAMVSKLESITSHQPDRPRQCQEEWLITAVSLNLGNLRSEQGWFNKCHLTILGVCTTSLDLYREMYTWFSKTKDGLFLIMFPLRNSRNKLYWHPTGHIAICSL